VPARLAGVFLFLPVPLVLFLFTRAPLGILPSLGVGTLLMLSHRVYARPWATARAHQRCLWCGSDLVAPSAPELVIDDPLGRTGWRACGDAHALATRVTLAWAARRQAVLKLGILGCLAVFLAWAAASALRGSPSSTFGDAVAFFRFGVALTVLPLGWLAARAASAPVERVRAPFPLHVPALVGLRSVLWLFRLVGLVWLAQGVLHVAQRSGLLA
jgi:hypothetical protein